MIFFTFGLIKMNLINYLPVSFVLHFLMFASRAISFSSPDMHYIHLFRTITVTIKIVRHHAESLLRISKYVSFTQTCPKLPEHPHYRSSPVQFTRTHLFHRITSIPANFNAHATRTDNRSGSIFTDSSLRRTSVARQRFQAFISHPR